ncbi:hypothetical protein ACQPXB_23420 [Amycolatopsis sp. CA-161197]|uniref:hypothetical protein n=1 Tax=Amycolatopsis sp. CA-161197 TaxID=3239922 RepID=UPI003D8D73D2
MIDSAGSARIASHVQVTGRFAAPRTVNVQSPATTFGVGPADSTGNPGVTYWPGGTRAGSTSVWRVRWKLRVNAIRCTSRARLLRVSCRGAFPARAVVRVGELPRRPTGPGTTGVARPGSYRCDRGLGRGTLADQGAVGEE